MREVLWGASVFIPYQISYLYGISWTAMSVKRVEFGMVCHVVETSQGRMGSDYPVESDTL